MHGLRGKPKFSISKDKYSNKSFLYKLWKKLKKNNFYKNH